MPLSTDMLFQNCVLDLGQGGDQTGSHLPGWQFDGKDPVPQCQKSAVVIKPRLHAVWGLWLGGNGEEGLLFFEHGGHGLIQVSGGCRAEAGGDGQQGIHLLILLQDLVVLRTALMVGLHPACTHTRTLHRHRWTQLLRYCNHAMMGLFEQYFVAWSYLLETSFNRAYSNFFPVAHTASRQGCREPAPFIIVIILIRVLALIRVQAKYVRQQS